MTTKVGVPWKRVLAEGAAIVTSILLAFAIQAWWDGVQLARSQSQFLADLADEFRDNRERLSTAVERQRGRREALRALIREAGSAKLGLGSDSLRALATATAFNPVFRASTDAIERGTGLEVVRDPYLRRRISGFWSRYEYYFENQARYVDLRLSPAVVYGTGTAALVELHALDPADEAAFWSQPLTTEQTTALKFFAMAAFLSTLAIDQGEEILSALDAMITDLEAAASG